jgi:anhydro-N-acetylmuramic acid kinase
MDGIDLAMLETDGEAVTKFGATLSVDYSPAERGLLVKALEDAKGMTDRHARPGCLAEAEAMITARHADAVGRFLAQENLARSDIDLLGFHGQTVLHRPDNGLTVQIGDGEALAQATGIATIFDMRAADMEVGGQGAPLVSAFHAALAKQISARPLVFVNIGGISNITVIGRDEAVSAFDVGPGNALIDQWVQAGAGVPFDQGGSIASEGGVSAEIVKRYMTVPFFDVKPPKSLDRFDFKALEPDALNLHDGARTLAHVTAKSIYSALDHLDQPPKLWLLSGGGRLNAAIVADLRSFATEDDADVLLCEDYGFDGDMMEAQAFAFLAVRSARGLPLTFPSTTGCKSPSCGGVLARP